MTILGDYNLNPLKHLRNTYHKLNPHLRRYPKISKVATNYTHFREAMIIHKLLSTIPDDMAEFLIKKEAESLHIFEKKSDDFFEMNKYLFVDEDITEFRLELFWLLAIFACTESGLSLEMRNREKRGEQHSRMQKFLLRMHIIDKATSIPAFPGRQMEVLWL